MSEIDPREILRQQAETAQSPPVEWSPSADFLEVQNRLARHSRSLTVTASYIISELQKRAIKPDVTLVEWRRGGFIREKIIQGSPVARGWKTMEEVIESGGMPASGERTSYVPPVRRTEVGSCLLVQSGMGRYIGRGAVVNATGVYPDFFTNPEKYKYRGAGVSNDEYVYTATGFHMPVSFSWQDNDKIRESIGLPNEARYSFSDDQKKMWYFVEGWLKELSHFARSHGIS